MKRIFSILFFLCSITAFSQGFLRKEGCEIYPTDNATTTVDEWVVFDGIRNHINFGDVLDAVFSNGASTYFEVEFKIRNYSLSNTDRLVTKNSITTTNRSWAISKANGDLNFYWSVLGTTARQFQVTWASALTDTNEHTLIFIFDGSQATALAKCTLKIDGTTITGGKSLTVNTGAVGNIFSSSNRLCIGQNYGQNIESIETTFWYHGEFKELVIRSAGAVVELSGINTPEGVDQFGSYKKYAQPIINGTKDASAQDNVQCTLNAVVDVGHSYYVYTLMSNPLINSDRDVNGLVTIPKSNDLTTGWSKRLSGGLPEIVYDIGTAGKFDDFQVWLRNVRRKSDGTFEAWPIGQSGTTFKMGYSTSSDGITWTRQNSGNPVYDDVLQNITIASIIFDDQTGNYKMVYTGFELGQRMCYASSPDGQAWTLHKTDILKNQGLGQVNGFQKYGNYYYIWAARTMVFFSGISDQIVLYRTTDLTNDAAYEYLGYQFGRVDGSEFGLTGPTVGPVKRPNGQFSFFITSYKNHIGKVANDGEEFTCVKLIDLNRCDIPVAGSVQTNVYPSYVARHWPLNQESASSTNLPERIAGTNATINTTPVFTVDATYKRTLGFLDLNGSQTITDTNNPGGLFNPATFGVKMRISLTLTGTHELFRIGNDVLVTLESGNLRVRLSSNGAGYEKDYITTADILKPASMSYIDDHIYVGFTWIGGVLTLYSDFVPVAVTKTVDTALTNVNDSGDDFKIGQNANVDIRSVSLMTGITDQQWIDLEVKRFKPVRSIDAYIKEDELKIAA